MFNALAPTLAFSAMAIMWHCLAATSSLGASFERDPLGRITEVNNGDGTITRYTYDANGNRLSRERIDNRRTIAATVDPPASGAVTGDGTKILGDTASLSATPAGGFLFHHWSEGGTSVGTDPALSFTVSVSRSLIAHFVPATPINTWRQAHFGSTVNAGDAADIADPDGDGVKNLAEFGFGLDPKVSQNGVITVVGDAITQRGSPTTSLSTTQSGVDFRAVFGRRKDYVAAGLTYTVQFSGDLASWVNSVATPTVLADDGEIQAVSVPYPFFAGTKKARFFRVAISIAP